MGFVAKPPAARPLHPCISTHNNSNTIFPAQRHGRKLGAQGAGWPLDFCHGWAALGRLALHPGVPHSLPGAAAPDGWTFLSPPPLPPPLRLQAAVAPPQVLPHQTAGDKPRVDELFEHRWRKAYEVRALERESRQAKGQVGG